MSMENGEQGTGNGNSLPAPWFSPCMSCCAAFVQAEICRHPERRLSDSPFHIPRSRRQQGFSLLEVIAAIMLLAITFIALMKVAGGSIGLTQNAAGYSEAALWARSKLDSAFVGEPLKPGHSSGQFNAKYRWQMNVMPWNQLGAVPPNALLHLYQLDLDVLWGPSAHPRSAHFHTLRLTGPDVAADNPNALQSAP